MEIRSFLALELTPEMKTVVSRVYEDVRKSPLDIRWARPEGIHLTLVFMGNIKSDDLEAMGYGIGEVCSSFPPFLVSLKGMGCFPNVRNPRVIWIGLDGDVEALSRFKGDLQNHLVPFGIEEEKRSFRPHLTLGRLKKPLRDDLALRNVLERHKDLASPVCTLHELVLFKSDLKPGGAVYTKMLSWRLLGTQ